MENIPATGSSPLVCGREHPLERADWDVWISSRYQGSFFHTAAWAAVLHRSYGFRPVYFAGTRGRQLESLLPVMEINSWITGRRGVSLPFTDFCEPPATAAASLPALFDAAMEYGRKRKWRYLECRGGRQFLRDVPASVSFYGHRLNLFPDIDFLFSKLESSVRRAIRKAESSPLTIEISTGLDAVRNFYVLHGRTRKEHGLPPQPFRFFRHIREQILSQNLGIVVTARRQSRPVAAVIFFRKGSEAIYKFGASDRRFQDLRANNLVMWEGIKWLARRGVKTLHFGRTSLGNEGLRRYKLGWGADEHRIDYFKYDLLKAAFVSDHDNAHGWHNRIFRALPRFASRWAGAALYRHIA